MSDQIIAAFSEQYNSTVTHLVQQQGSVFRGKVREESQTGKTAFYEQLGSTSAVKRTSRHADTPRIDSVHNRRQVTLNDYDWSDLIDKFDMNKMIINPETPYVQSAVWALGRSQDQEVIDNATGTAYADKTGTGTITTATLGSAQQVVVGTSGLTLAKLISAKSILGKNEVPRGTKFYIAHRQQQLDDLLNNVNQVQSSDYNNVKALVDGEINYFMGFEFIKTELLTNVTATDVTSCIAYAYPGLLLAVGNDITTRMSERDDKNYSMQVYAGMSVGATRMQEEMVVEVFCDESP